MATMPLRTLAAAILPALCATLAAAPAQAGRAETCFSRSYDAAHLRAHPRQRVDAVWLQRDPAAPPGPSAGDEGDRWALMLRIGGEVFSGVAACRNETCTVEGDGGAFTLRRASRGLELRVGKRLTLEGERRFSPDLGASADDRLFRLRPAPPARCAAARA